MNEERRLYITKGWVVTIFSYYIFLFVGGSIFSVITLLGVGLTEVDIFKRTLLGSGAIAVTAASIAYIRKLYKLCFQYSSDQETADQIFLKRLGTIVYFMTRPIFSIAFAMLVVISLKSALLLSSTTEVPLEEGFMYISMITSFYVGFLSGEFIKKLEKDGLDKIRNPL